MIERCSLMRQLYWRWFWHPKQTFATDQIRLALEYKTGNLLVATENNKLVGALCYVEYPKHIHVNHLGSLQKGTGSALLKVVLSYGKNVSLYCSDYNIPFYEKYGFVKQEYKDDRYVGNIMIYTWA